MSIDNDQLFNEVLDNEYEKIPVFFKLSKTTAKIALGAIAVFCALSMLFIVFFYRSGTYEMIPHGDSGYSMGVNIYNNDYLKYAIICLAMVIVVAFWLFMVQYYEKRAFAKASEFASRVHYANLQKREMQRNKEIFQFRPTKTIADDPAFWTFKKSDKK